MSQAVHGIVDDAEVKSHLCVGKMVEWQLCVHVHVTAIMFTIATLVMLSAHPPVDHLLTFYVILVPNIQNLHFLIHDL